jgi:zinc-ribbon domain
MMSSATSIDPAARRPGSSTAKRPSTSVRGAKPPQADEAAAADQGLRPWQFFVLAGMLSATAVVIVATGQSPAAIVILSLTVLSASLVAMGVHRSLSPLAHPEAAAVPQLLGGRTRAALEREKTLVLRAIKDLEFDFAMKKISQADFDDMAVRLRGRAIGLIQQLDAGAGYRRAIEQELEQRQGAERPAPAAVAEPGDDEPSAPDAATCASCGEDNDTDARFCKHCGTRLGG